MDEPAIFPFGRPSSPRPPRRPTHEAALFVLGVYPSALHVRWTPPLWAIEELGIGPVGALAVDDEPTVFWDGADALQRVEQWEDAVNFRDGDTRGKWGHVRAMGNGTSGQSVVERVLEPLAIEAAHTWFSDSVDRFFVKTGGTARQQADVIQTSYKPFAQEVGLPAATLPPRPSVSKLVNLAATEHRPRLRSEITAADVPTIVTLGEEARRVLVEIADDVTGPPTRQLDSGRLSQESRSTYGEAGTATVGALTMTCHALIHPGQRGRAWAALHDDWMSRVRNSLGDANPV